MLETSFAWRAFGDVLINLEMHRNEGSARPPERRRNVRAVWSRPWNHRSPTNCLRLQPRDLASVPTLGRLALANNSDAVLSDWWHQARLQVPRHFQRGFDSIVLLVSWELWNVQNCRTFQAKPPSPSLLFSTDCRGSQRLVGGGLRSYVGVHGARCL